LADRVRSATTTSEIANAFLVTLEAVDLADLKRRSGGGEVTIGTVIGRTAVAPSFVDSATERAVDIVSRYHDEHPMRPGMPSAELASRLDVERDMLAHLVNTSDGLTSSDGSVSLAGFSSVLSEDQEVAWGRARLHLETSFDVPRASQIDLEDELIHALIRRGDLVRINDDLVFTASQLESLTDRIVELDDGFTVSEFKDHFGMARRQAVPLLEWLDKSGATRRDGDGRVVRRRNGS
jgi:selenocysteine-specific elongation factor